MNLVHLYDYELISNLPKNVIEHPGMISLQERQLLYSLTHKNYTGEGYILDTGVFLGASTQALCQGLVDRKYDPGNRKPIQSFERAIVGPNFTRHAIKNNLPNPSIGESFEIILRELISNTNKYVDLHVGDILEYDPSNIDHIEIAFLDILKNEQISNYCFNNFIPKIKKGGYIIQQDYYFDDLPFIKYMTEAIDEFLEYKGEVRSSALFKVVMPVDMTVLKDRLINLSDDDKLYLHEKAEQRTSSLDRQYLMQMSRSRLLTQLNRVDDAEEVWKQAQVKYEDQIYDENGNVKDNISWRHDRLNTLIDRFKNRK